MKELYPFSASTIIFEMQRVSQFHMRNTIPPATLSSHRENEPIKQFLHDALKGTFISIKETAVATCTVIHVLNNNEITVVLLYQNDGYFLQIFFLFNVLLLICSSHIHDYHTGNSC